jgi:protoheme IX farnesyltransferase
LLLSAIGGAFLGAKGFPGWGQLGLVFLTGGMAASGAAGWNQYLERHTDHRMGRTRKRPLVTGELGNPIWVPIVATLLIFIPVLATLPFNPAWSFFLFLGAFIYVVIYTIWLKPRTVINIVIGGAAGSAAVMAGAAAVGAWRDPAVIVLALLLYAWTPTHFWSLALLYREDYKQADVPMLPARTSRKLSAWWVMSHTIPTVLGAVGLAIMPALGWLYLIPVLYFSVDLIRKNIRLIGDPSQLNAKSMFLSSNIYLMIILLAICVDTVLISL